LGRPAGGSKIEQRDNGMEGMTLGNNKYWDVVSRQAILKEGGIPLVEVK